MFTQQALKQQVSDAALSLLAQIISPNMVIGVGTGSTADIFIEGLARFKGILRGAVPSSERSAQRLKAVGLPVLELNEVDTLPIYIDGADEINPQLHMIKGGGGALTREKIVASAAQRFICMVDESKHVKYLGRFPLPIEVIPMAQAVVSRTLIKLGGQPTLRSGFTTDNGHIILDVAKLKITDAPVLEAQINNIPGVVSCGLFAIAGADTMLMATQSGIHSVVRPY